MSWSNLPLELLSSILSRLLLMRDRHAFKAVCKSWSFVTSVRSSNPPSLPPSIDSPYYDSPCLMISQGNDHSWKLFHSVYNDFYYLNIPELVDAEIRFCKYEWLLMSRGDTLFFFNPFTMVKIGDLPRAIAPFVSVSFTFPPTSDECLIFGVYSTSTISSSDIGLLSFKYDYWYYYSFPNFCEFGEFICPPVFCNEKFYIFGKYGNIRVFDPPVMRLLEYSCDHESKFGEELKECYIAEVGGEIWGVFVLMDKSFSVEKLDVSLSSRFEKHIKWVTLKSLGNKCFYVGPNGSFVETCKIKGMDNAIYFNKFHDCSGVLYSMSSNKYHSIDGEYTSRDPYKLTETGYDSCWIKPPKGVKLEIDWLL